MRLSGFQQFCLITLRTAIGWHFAYEGFYKLMLPGWTRGGERVAAHLAHVSYAGRVGADGRVEPRYTITLASGIPEAVCRRVRLGFAEWGSIDLPAARQDPDTLVVDNAGRDLFLIHK